MRARGALGLLGLLLLLGPAGAWYKHVASPRFHTVGRAAGLLMGIRRSPYLWRRDAGGERARSPGSPAPAVLPRRGPGPRAGGPGSPAPRGREPAALARLALQDLTPRRTSARQRLPPQSRAGLPPQRARPPGARGQTPPARLERVRRKRQPGTGEDFGERR